MSLHAPFLVKQYLSDDLEHGSYSRIFWYYPLDEQRALQGGIGLFFEVLSGDVDDDVYEQITKRFWENFNDHFYTDGFELALKHSIKMFIQLLRSFGVEEGLDVNIVLCNVVVSQKGYTLKLISFGDSDIFVVRQGKYADMGKLVPENASLYDLKFLEVELDRGDSLLLGNKTLLRNAFESEMIMMSSLEELLASLEAFKDNLFGSKKMFLISLGHSEETASVQANKTAQILQKSVETTKQIATRVGNFVTDLLAKIQKKVPVEDVTRRPSEFPVENETAKDTVLATEDELDFTKPELDQVHEVSQQMEDHRIEPMVEEEPHVAFVTPPPVAEEPEFVEQIIEIDLPAVPRVTTDRLVNADDFIIAGEITTSMVGEKSTYQDIVDDAVSSEYETQEAPVQPIVKNSHSTASFIPTAATRTRANTNYVQELRSMHSPWAKIMKNQNVKATITMLVGLWELLVRKVLALLGRKPVAGTGGQKMYLSKPSTMSVKKIPPGIWVILGIMILVVFFWIRSTLAQNALEKNLLGEFQQTVSTFNTFYEQNIVPIDTEDSEKQLELCAGEAQKVYAKQSDITPKLKSKQALAQAAQGGNDVKSKEAQCQSKYDRVYGIIRVTDADLVTDFKVSLGNDSDVTSMTFRGGSLVVADKGRKSIYQLNVDTKSIMKLEDPLSLVTSPTVVGSGEGTLFVCDQTNGVLYYTNNASGHAAGFNRMVGSEPSSIGECVFVDGFGKNAYVVPASGNGVYKVEPSGAGYGLPKKYINDLLGVRALSIDGNIYVTSTTNGTGNVVRYFGGKLDSFAVSDSVDLGELTASFTNPSNDRPLYVYDKTKNAVLVIEKPAGNRHPGKGVLIKTYQFQNNDKFNDVKSFVIDVNGNNQETNMYVLSGTTVWKFRLK